MKSAGLPFLVGQLVVAVAIAVGCGSPATPPMQPKLRLGGLESITVNPPTADAQNYPDGEVPFVATGYYSTPPSPVTPLPVFMWGACQQNVPTSDVTVTSNGLTQCMAGAAGTYSVFASDPTQCNVIGPCGTGCFVTGTAQLTCP